MARGAGAGDDGGGGVVSTAAALYALVLALDVAVLDGTTSVEHMAEDLGGVERVAAWRRTEAGRETFDGCLAAFEEWISSEARG